MSDNQEVRRLPLFPTSIVALFVPFHQNPLEFSTENTSHLFEGRFLGLNPRKQVLYQRQEERHILRHEFGQVHIPQRPHHEERLALVRVLPLLPAGSPKNGQNIAQSEIVVRLLAQLLLAEAVEDEELLGEDVVLLEAARGQLDLNTQGLGFQGF
jgi:hypothetical protein